MGRDGGGSTGVCSSGGDTDQCCKVYQLHVIVTVVTAIVLFCLFSFKTTVGRGGDAQNFILIYDFYIYSVFLILQKC